MGVSVGSVDASSVDVGAAGASESSDAAPSGLKLVERNR